MLHSFYTMPINIVIGGVPTQTTVRWYKAPAGAKYLGIPTAIFSHVWDNNPGESVPGEIGELGSPRTWDPGRNPGYQGQCFRGDPTWFATGLIPALSTVPPSPCNCRVAPAVGSGGVLLSGAATVYPALPGCGTCPNGVPARWIVEVAGGTGAYAASNGQWVLVSLGFPCTWQLQRSGPGGVYQTSLQYNINQPGWQVDVSSPLAFGTQLYNFVGQFPCFGVSTNWVAFSPQSGAPTSISVQPST